MEGLDNLPIHYLNLVSNVMNLPIVYKKFLIVLTVLIYIGITVRPFIFLVSATPPNRYTDIDKTLHSCRL